MIVPAVDNIKVLLDSVPLLVPKVHTWRGLLSSLVVYLTTEDYFPGKAFRESPAASG